MTPLNMNCLHTLRAAGHVQRYHTEQGIEQNNAAHTWHALTLLLFIEPAISRGAIIHMQMHDVAEVFTGDHPAPVKWQYPELKTLLTRIEDEGMQSLGYSSEPLTEYEKVCVKFADSAELVLTCHEHLRRGNSYAWPPGSKVLARMGTMIVEGIGGIHRNERATELYEELRRLYGKHSKQYADWR